jgi:hypothetical protein
MTYGREHCARYEHGFDGAAVSHSAELVRGDFLERNKRSALPLQRNAHDDTRASCALIASSRTRPQISSTWSI